MAIHARKPTYHITKMRAKTPNFHENKMRPLTSGLLGWSAFQHVQGQHVQTSMFLCGSDGATAQVKTCIDKKTAVSWLLANSRLGKSASCVCFLCPRVRPVRPEKRPPEKTHSDFEQRHSNMATIPLMTFH